MEARGFEAQILRLVRNSLDRGLTVEIEGLGVFRKSAAGYAFEAQTQPQVFVAYAMEDLESARRICAALARAGCSPWLDKDKLLPGQNWPRAIQRAIEISDTFIACFSPRSIAKRGQFQSELRYTLDCARRLPMEEPFVIPVRLAPCDVPRNIAEQVHYVDLFPDWDRGLGRLIRAAGATRRREEPRLCV
jgi:hypothetical protein